MLTQQKAFKDLSFGKGRENIPNVAFRLMAFIMRMMDVFGNHSDRNFKTLGLKLGQTVVDYGCGPARYILNASKTVGMQGRVYAVDIHPLAIEQVKRKIKKYNLRNIEPILAKGYSCSVPQQSVDVVYALDMFHMISNPTVLLTEFARMVKTDGLVIIEDGHQSRSETKSKIEASSLFVIAEENKYHVVCRLRQ
ncbi:class I SAM-dependent methyltransferase [Marinilabiliaceae bacterium JC017]|nr:class I SAM-dependent methyltransferase [Marinilabiliaceae bacterium JC017]